MWKPVPGYEGFYEVSDSGQVKSLERTLICSDGRPKTVREKILKPKTNKYGYLSLGLWRSGKRKDAVVHRLVASAFLENPNKYEQVNHKDGDKLNNNVSNLEWCDNIYNMKHAVEHDLLSHQNGETHGGHILTEENVKEIRQGVQNGVKQCVYVNKFGVCQQTISDIVRGKIWKYLL